MERAGAWQPDNTKLTFTVKDINGMCVCVYVYVYHLGISLKVTNTKPTTGTEGKRLRETSQRSSPPLTQ